MSTASVRAPGAQAPAPQHPARPTHSRFGWAVRDALSMMGRNVRRLSRAPDQLVFTLISPIMFTLLFRYVFGGAIGGLQGINYVNYLIPGIAVQTAIFSSGNTGFSRWRRTEGRASSTGSGPCPWPGAPCSPAGCWLTC